LTKVEYRKIIWGLLKDYRDDLQMPLVELLDKIMAIGIPKEKKGKVTFNKKNPYVGMSTREDVDFGKGKKKQTYKDKFHKELG
jgi:hypothetical protein